LFTSRFFHEGALPRAEPENRLFAGLFPVKKGFFSARAGVSRKKDVEKKCFLFLVK
jgi:hypothetical protein